jgi:hypothetical protein
LPKLPTINFDKVQLEADKISLERTIGPWIDERIEGTRDACYVILWIGIIIAAIPITFMLASSLIPFVPHSWNRFFLHPEWDRQENATTIENGTENAGKN